jgi:hypothetical protein
VRKPQNKSRPPLPNHGSINKYYIISKKCENFYKKSQKKRNYVKENIKISKKKSY